MEQWFTWWNAVWNMDVQMINVTGAIAAVNVAGPNTRTVLSKLTDFDLSNEAFPYLAAGHAIIAGVPWLVLRIGFVGELGYEIHHPSRRRRDLWDAADGGRRGARPAQPSGLEPQRRLRLEKMHVIVGQDTDAESNPLEAAMPWIVKLDKEQRLGGPLRDRVRAERGLRDALVGFTVMNGEVPLEGAAVVGPRGGPAGRITSSRWSPRLGKRDRHRLGEDRPRRGGHRVRDLLPRRLLIPATVTHSAFHDPDGERLRS